MDWRALPSARRAAQALQTTPDSVLRWSLTLRCELVGGTALALRMPERLDNADTVSGAIMASTGCDGVREGRLSTQETVQIYEVVGYPNGQPREVLSPGFEGLEIRTYIHSDYLGGERVRWGRRRSFSSTWRLMGYSRALTHY